MTRLPPALSLVLALCCQSLAAAQTPTPAPRPDREYTLQASMLGYRGVGGELEGVRNPVLRASRGETVRITIVGVEALPHDLAMEKLGIKTREVTAVGDRAELTFV